MTKTTDETTSSNDSDGLVGSVVQAAAILRYVARTSEPQGVTLIARALNISQSSCFNIIKTLVAEGYLERNPRSKAYTLGVAPLDLARRILDEDGIFRFLAADLQRLADRFSVTTSLWRRTRSDRWVMMGLTENLSLGRIHMSIGQRLPMYGGAMGRCAAAFNKIDRDELLGKLKSVKWYSTPDEKQFLKDAALVRARGWAHDENQFMQFFSSLSSPILDQDDQIRFCITQTMFQGQHRRDEIVAMGEATRAVAENASLHIYGRRTPLAAKDIAETKTTKKRT